jgi:undecaprenyl-diphosphatase
VQLLQTILLGLIQGFSEWLPISSTAHLTLAEIFLNLKATPLLGITLHVGTLIVVVFYFRREVKSILASIVHWDFKTEYGQFIPLLVVAMIPTGIIGLLYVIFLENIIEAAPTHTLILMIGITFLIGATMVYTSRIGKEDKNDVTYTTALIMGIAQGLAIFQGLSRSGMTISTALLLGLKREKAFKFSFLLSIPAVIGDLAVEAYTEHGQFATQAISRVDLLAGIVLAMIAGYIAIKLVVNTVRSKRFHYFAIYTWLLGITLIVLALSGF